MQNKIRAWWEKERWQAMLWLPVPIGVGVGIYFHLHDEPPLWMAVSPFIISLILLIGVGIYKVNCHPRAGGDLGLHGITPEIPGQTRDDIFKMSRIMCMSFTLVSLGFLAAYISTYSGGTPILAEKTGFLEVKGRVADLKVLEKGSKLILENPQIEGISPEDTPRKVSLSLKFYDAQVQVGDEVSLIATLMPPSTPVMPGAFDFTRYYYFKGIGAIGFGIPPLTKLPGNNPKTNDIAIADAQHRITERIRASMSAPEGAVGAALITGITSAIPKEVFDTMRVSGLYHLLAVSGMNLAIVAGIFFFMARWVLVLIPRLAIYYPIKKWAAIIAIIGSYGYLLIAGSPVSAERAFYMVALLLSAVMLDRVVTPMRSLAWAAVVILLLWPEAMLGASFQLSFAATIGLIAFFDWFTPKVMKGREMSHWFYRFCMHIVTAILSTLVAGLATLPFLIYHFNTMATYSLLSNMLAIPLVTFWIMPCAVVGMLLMPLGLEVVGFYPMQWGITLMLKIAELTATLPAASLRIPALSDAGLVIFTLGGLWLAFWSTRIRLAGVIIMLVGLSSVFFYTPPDVLISPDGKQQAVVVDDTLVLVQGRAKEFVVKEWQEQLALSEIVSAREAKLPNLTCDAGACVFSKGGQRVSFVTHPSAAAEDCGKVDVLVNMGYGAEVCNQSQTIDWWKLKQSGAMALWLSGQGVTVESVNDTRGNRPWVKE